MSIGSKSFARALLGAAIALGLPAAYAGDITLYQQPGFQGDSLTLHRQAPNLESTGLNDRASSVIVRSGLWEACTGAFFEGPCVRLEPGEYSHFEGLRSNRVASVREVVAAAAVEPPISVAAGEPRIALFAQPGFGGRSIELTRTAGDLDRISSYSGAQAVIVYSGTWRLCSHDYYRGDCTDFSPGRYDSLGRFGDRVASAELISSTPAPVGVVTPPAPMGRVVLFEFPDFGGRSLVIQGTELPNLEGTGFDNRAASMRIESGTWMFCTDAGFQGECHTLGPGEYPRLARDVGRRIASARRVPDVYGEAESTSLQ